MKHIFSLLILFSLLIQGCIGDDFVDDNVEPILQITTTPDTLALGSTFQFEAMYLNNIGAQESVDVQWESADQEVISISSPDGLAQALQIGSSTIRASYQFDEKVIEDIIEIHVGQNTVDVLQSKSGTIETTSFYTLKGDFEFIETEEGVLLDIAENYEASSGLPGLYIYLSNNPNSIANALEVSAVDVFNGAHRYDIPNVDFEEYQFIVYFCKPFNVKVGQADL